jgi:AcrR family transcriptional regulator
MKQQRLARTHRYHHGDLRRVLIDAALILVREEQDWTFSLREVARRAGVSHNAPYNHFVDKNDLLAAIAAAGFDALRERLFSSTAEIDNPKTALIKCGVAYVAFGMGNPALYRLMFGSAVSKSIAERPSPLALAAAGARSVLEGIILRGAQAGVFAASPHKRDELQLAVLTTMSTVHGLTMLAVDGLIPAGSPDISVLTDKVSRLGGTGIFRR